MPGWLSGLAPSGFAPTLLALPVALPMVTAGLLLALSRLDFRRRVRAQRRIAGTAGALNLLLALWILVETVGGRRIVYQVGSWPAPFGITLYADALSGILLTTVGLLSLLLVPYAAGTLDRHRKTMGYYPLAMLLLMGVNGVFLAGDFFNLYVFIEVLLMASFVLITLGGTPGQINGGIRYVILNLMASTTLLTAAGLTYGTLGTLNIAQMAERLQDAPEPARFLLAGLLLIAFGSKAGIFPLFFWLPASYHTPPPAVTALFGGILTKVGVYVLFRLFPLLFPDVLDAWQPLLMAIAALTMLVGGLGAYIQPTLRRMLAFGIISQIGYMIMALGIALDTSRYGAGFALAAGILFLVHNMLVKTALLMGAGLVEIEMGSGSLRAIGGLAQRQPLLALIFFVAAFSLAGIPPASGFVGKLSLLAVTLDTKQYWVAGASLVASLLTLMTMLRLWQYPFWGEYRSVRPHWTPLHKPGAAWMTVAPMALLVALSLALGLFFRPALRMAMTAADHALDRAAYIAAVNPLPVVPDEPALWEPSASVPKEAAAP